jgi:NADH dehydrogenase/NADH:ubiquinone oxidoreductase subunit G
MKLTGWIVLLALLALPAAVSAEFYRYVDQDGKTHYTDDIANVPADQRSHVSEYDDAALGSSGLRQETETTIQEQGGREATLSPPQEVLPQRTPRAKADETETSAQRLEETGKALEGEYETLTEERKELDEASKRPMTPAMRENLVERVKDFNTRIKEYEKRRAAFNGEVEAYNAGIEKKGQAPEGETN